MEQGPTPTIVTVEPDTVHTGVVVERDAWQVRLDLAEGMRQGK